MNPAAGSILASVIKSHHRISSDPALLDKVEGIVSSVDATSGTFTLFITESRGFVPVPNLDGTITIRVDATTLWENITGINFLAPRMNVEILGAWNPASNDLLAAKVEAKGADDDDPTLPNPPPPGCTTVPQKTLLNYGASAFPVFEVEHITLSSVLTGTDVSVTASNGQTYFLVNTTKLEKEPSLRLCVDDLFTYLGKTIEIKYVVGSAGEKVALKLEVK